MLAIALRVAADIGEPAVNLELAQVVQIAVGRRIVPDSVEGEGEGDSLVAVKREFGRENRME